jgi:hypothetical protein
MANSTATTYGDDCVLMLKCDGTDASTTFTDSSDSAHTVTANGNAQVDTAQSKFSGASLIVDGAGDYLSIPDSDNWNLGTGDFTIDFFVRFNGDPSGTTTPLLGQYQNGTNKWEIYYDNTVIWFRQNNAGSVDIDIQKTWNPATATWYHVELDRSGSNWYFFIDGTQVGTTGSDASSIASFSGELYIGRRLTDGGGNQYLNAWVDEVRIVKGQALHTANFTAPIAQYTSDSSGGGLAVLGRRPIRSHYRGVMR